MATPEEWVSMMTTVLKTDHPTYLPGVHCGVTPERVIFYACSVSHMVCSEIRFADDPDMETWPLQEVQDRLVRPALGALVARLEESA